MECYLDKASINNFMLPIVSLIAIIALILFYCFFHEKEKPAAGLGDPKAGGSAEST